MIRYYTNLKGVFKVFYKDLASSTSAIANKFHTSDTHALEIFDRYVKMDRLPLSDIISVDEVHLDMDEHCRYALVIQNFYTGDPIDLLQSRRTATTEPYFVIKIEILFMKEKLVEKDKRNLILF